MTRIVHLDEHVSRVDSYVLDLLDSPNCNLLLLSDVQVSVLKQMTFPYALWSTRLVEDHEAYQICVDFPQSYRDELECLELLLSGGDTMTCDLSAVLSELAQAIRAGGPSANGGCGSGQAVVLNCLSSLLPGEIVPQPDEPPPEYGVPPAGFVTWEEYVIYKCKAANAIVDATANLFGALSLAPPVATTAIAINTLITGYLGGIALAGVVFPPAALIAIAAGAVALGILEGAAFVYLQDVRQYIFDNRDDFACALFNSGSAAAAQSAVAVFLDDAVQSVAWGAIFGGVVGPEVAAILGSIAGQMDTTNLVNALFRATEDFVYPDVTCCSGQPPAGPDWHFDADTELWSFSSYGNEGDVIVGAWNAGGDLPDPNDSSPGQLQTTIDKPTPPVPGTHGAWTYQFPWSQIPQAVAGDALKVDVYCSVSAAAEFNIYINYTDATNSSLYYPNPGPAWVEKVVAATPGKFVASLSVDFGVGESDVLHDARIDNVRWGQ